MSAPDLSDSQDQAVRRLLDCAAQAVAGGRAKEAEQFLHRAEAEAPTHPLVLNERARRLIEAGEPDAAVAMLRRAVETEPSDPAPWFSLARALERMGRADEELAALEKGLSLDPRNFPALLRAGALLEAQGQSRGAAATYRIALQSATSGLPPELMARLPHAKAMIAANDRALEGFLAPRLEAVRRDHPGAAFDRFEHALDLILQKPRNTQQTPTFRTPIGKRRVFRPRPTFLNLPDLPTHEFFDRADFPWLDRIEAATADIRAELIQALAEDGPAALEPYVSMRGTPGEQWRALNNSRRWGVHFLWRAGVPYAENLARSPKTTAALEAWPRCALTGTGPTAVFSILDAKTRIPPHVGVNNARLIVHLPLVVPPGCGFRVGNTQREWEPGKAFVFDDTIEHEAWNDSDEPRAVLIFDIWNPHVTPAERDLITVLTAGVADYYGELPSFLGGAPA